MLYFGRPIAAGGGGGIRSRLHLKWKNLGPTPIRHFHRSCRMYTGLKYLLGQFLTKHSGTTFAPITCTAVRKRQLSSSSSSSSHSLSSETWWKESTVDLLDRENYPIGSFDTLQWHMAETMLFYWVDKGRVGLEVCFQIMDRLADEAVIHPQFQMKVYLINAILGNWNKTFQSFESRLLPSQIVHKVQGYLSRAPGLFEPNIATYTIVLDGASYCPDPAERIAFSEELLEWLFQESKDRPSLRPTEVTIGTVLKSWRRSGSAQGAQKAEALLRRIIQLSKHDQWKDLEVNTIHYTTVLDAYANAGDATSAERLLREMYEQYMIHGNSKVRPNVRSFNAVITAWSRTFSPEAFASADALFVKMEELHQSGALEEPRTAVTYNWLLNTLARNSRHVVDAVEKAEALVDDLIRRFESNSSNESIMKPSAVTIAALLRILAASHHPARDEKVSFWLKRAQEIGISDERFLLDQYQTHLLRNRRQDRPTMKERRNNPSK